MKRKTGNRTPPSYHKPLSLKNKVLINEDWGNAVCFGPTEEALRKHVRSYAEFCAGGVLIENVNAMVSNFDSKKYQTAYDGISFDKKGNVLYHGKKPEKRIRQYLETPLKLMMLDKNVKDNYNIRYEVCHEFGADMWLSFRMNDVHNVHEPWRPMHNNFWRNHVELRRAQYKAKTAFWNAQGFDYEKKETRDHQLVLIEEVLDRFDTDGIELDWMRTPPHFRPGFDEINMPVITAFMRRVKALVTKAEQKRKRPIQIAVRTPSRPVEALEMGFDVFKWAEEGLIDVVIVSPYFETSDSDAPVEIWRRLLPKPCQIALCIEYHVQSGYASIVGTEETAYGYASTYLYRGADTIYLYNYFQPKSDIGGSMERIYGTVAQKDKVDKCTRRHIVTYHETFVEGARNELYLPSCLARNWTCPVRLNVGGSTAGRKAYVIVGFSSENAEKADLEVRLDTVLCREVKLGNLPRLPEKAGIYYRRYSVPAGTLHDGTNVVDLLSRDEKPAAPKWLEICIEKHK